MSTSIAVKLESLSDFYTRYEKGILVSSLFLCVLLFWRFCWHNDYLIDLFGVAILTSWFVVVVFTKKWDEYGRHLEEGEVRIGLLRFAAAVTLVSLTSFCFVTSGVGGIAVNTKTHESTIGQLFLLSVPFGGDVVPVGYDYDISVNRILIQTTDAKPLLCNVQEHNIQLDFRSSSVLPQFLASDAPVRNPGARMTSDIEQALRTSAIATMSTMSSNDVANSTSKFTIQYDVGTPIGNALRDDGLRWQDGLVSYDCNVVFNS